ncbi:MAG: hypothetical protein WKF59_24905 [Chitinophagaceae bacterium]
MYTAYVEDRPERLSKLPIQYVDYALWQRNYLQGELLDKKTRYWKQKLKGVELITVTHRLSASRRVEQPRCIIAI